MKYVYNGKYTQFMGRQFAYGNPVEITDRATLEAIAKRPDFAPYEAKAPVLSDECPKCHRIVKRGKFMHQQHCKGK
jgi:hypothetical protein